MSPFTSSSLFKITFLWDGFTFLVLTPPFHLFTLSQLSDLYNHARIVNATKDVNIDHSKSTPITACYTRIQEFFKSDDDIDVMQRVMQEEALIENANEVSRELEGGKANKANARILLSAPLIKKYSREVLEEGEEASRLVEKATRLVERVLDQDTISLEVKSSWREYVRAFRRWQRPNKKCLLNALIADYCAWSEVLESFEGQALNEWQPYVKTHQANIKHQIARIGGKAGLTQLCTAVEERMQGKGGQSSRNDKFENVKIVHEMMLDPSFSATKLFEANEFEASLKASTALVREQPALLPDLAMALVKDAEKQLLLLVPEASSIVDRIHAVMDLDVFEHSLRHTTDPSIQLTEIDTNLPP